MTPPIYTAITFAPVQGFIEKSRKLRDLYGSSYLLSFLSWAVCDDIDRQFQAHQQPDCRVISPALANVTQGMPNQIVIKGAFPIQTEDENDPKTLDERARAPLDRAWSCLVETCQGWIEQRLSDFSADYPYWKREWGLWAKYAWEFFWVRGEPGETISQVRQKLNDVKRSRGWVGINWVGESSTLSGADAIAYPKLGTFRPDTTPYQQQRRDVRTFYEKLSASIGEAFIDPDEELSIPELIKRIITREDVANAVIDAYEQRLPYSLSDRDQRNLRAIAQELNPKSFRDLNRLRQQGNSNEPKYWTGWFLGDGDSAGNYLKSLSDDEDEADKLEKFSTQMRQWGCVLRHNEREILPAGQGRFVYAGGDDFLGVLYGEDNSHQLYQIQPETCLDWFRTFKTQVWDNSEWDQKYRLPLDVIAPRRNEPISPKPITVSVGFVWAAPNVPQRDVLQHCREAERSAKQGGRDRIAFRILFNGGNHVEWVCPWWLLEGKTTDIPAPVPLPMHDEHPLGILQAYRDRNGTPATSGKANWTHLYNDVAALQARHAFQPDETSVALGLIEIYFGSAYHRLLSQPANWWNTLKPDETIHFAGILGSQKRFTKVGQHHAAAATPPIDDKEVKKAFNQWVVDLATIAFHLHREVKAANIAS